MPFTFHLPAKPTLFFLVVEFMSRKVEFSACSTMIVSMCFDFHQRNNFLVDHIHAERQDELSTVLVTINVGNFMMPLP